MRIGIDCRTILNPAGGEFAGIGHYTDSLVRALAQEYPTDEFVLFFDNMISPQSVTSFSTYRNAKLVLLAGSQYRRFLPFVYSHLVVAALIAREQLDVFHGPAYTIPLGYNKPSVVTVHDLAIYQHPEWFREESGFAQKVLVPTSLRRARQVIAVSEATAKQIKNVFPEVAQKTQVVYEGVDQLVSVSTEVIGRVKEKFKIADRFLFFVGTIEPRKNIERLVKAFSQWKTEHVKESEGVQLVIAGGRGWKNENVFTAIDTSPYKNEIKVIGYISAEEKQALMQGCTVFVFPSLWEGFGLPVLEAAAAGAVVLTSRVSALPEVGGKGAYYVEPEHIGSIKNGIAELMSDEALREKLRTAAQKNAEQFTWKKVAQETMECYKKAVQ